jgi:hypothetical protein
MHVKISVGKYKTKIPFIGVRHGWDDNIKMEFKE